MRLWGRLNSINVQKVVWALEELNLPFTRVEAGMSFGIVDTPQFRAMNPNGRVPVLEDGELAIWESNAILRHLGRSRGRPRLWPDELYALSLADRWMDWQLGTLEAPMRVAFWGLIRTSVGRRDKRAIAAAMQEARAKWKIFEQHLECMQYVAGGSFTFADIPLGTFWWRYVRLGGDAGEFPSCAAWGERIAIRPAARVLGIPLS